MTLIDLCKLGLPALVGMARDGKLRPQHLWAAVEGATKYRDAVANGDIADEAVSQVRAEVHCANCLSHTKVDKGGIVRLFCGEAFVNRTDTALPTCGCLTAISVDGVVYPAGLTMVRSAKCVQEKW